MESELIFQYLLAAFIYPVLSKKTDENSRNTLSFRKERNSMRGLFIRQVHY